MKLQIIYFLIFIFLSTPLQSAEPKERKQMGIDEFIETVRKEDPKLKEILLDKLRLNYQEALILDEDKLEVHLASSYKKNLEDADDSSSTSAKIAKTWQGSGTTVSLEYKDDNTSNNGSKTTAKISQSLIKNSFGSKNRKQTALARLRSDIIQLEAIDSYEEHISKVMIKYLEWVLADFKLEAARVAETEAKKMTSYVRRRVASGISIAIDLQEAILREMEKTESRLEQEGQYNSLIEELKRYPSLNQIHTLKPSYDRIFHEVSTSTTFKSERSSQIHQKKIEEAQTSRDLLSEELRSELTISLSYSHTNPSTPAHDPIKEAIIGLDWKHPFQQSRTEGKLLEKEYEVEKAIRKSEVDKSDKSSQLARLREEIANTKDLIVLAQKHHKTAKNIYWMKYSRYKRGLLDFTELASAKSRLDQSYVSKMSHKVDLSKKMVKWLNLTDDLIKKTNLELDLGSS